MLYAKSREPGFKVRTVLPYPFILRSVVYTRRPETPNFPKGVMRPERERERERGSREKMQVGGR